MATAQGTLWVCVDCYFAREGEPPQDPCCEPWNLLPDLDVTPGRRTDECGHDLQDPSDGDAHSEDCEMHDFSRWPCDACGCHLAGTRYAYTWWSEE